MYRRNCLGRGAKNDKKPEPRQVLSAAPGYNLSLEEARNMLFTMQFALDVIENAELGNTTNKSNWTLDKSLEEQIELLQAKL